MKIELLSGYSRDTVQRNIATLRSSGLTDQSAIYTALCAARKSFFSKFKHGALPVSITYPGVGRLRENYNADGSPIRKNPISKNRFERITNKLSESYRLGARYKQLQPEKEVYYYYTGLANAKKNIILMTRHWKEKEFKINPSKREPKQSAINQAAKLIQDFSGHKARVFGRVEFPPNPDVGVVIGHVLGVSYETKRDGVKEKYYHRFTLKHSRPLLVSSQDGKQLYLLGGEYDFTERGIVDRK